MFTGNEAVSRFQEYNQHIDSSSFYAPPGFQGQPQQGQQGQPIPQGPNQGQVPPGQTPRFTQPGPGFGPPPGQSGQFGQQGFGGGFGGPSQECFAAIQSGDFVKAKTLCAPPTGSYPGQQTPGQYQQQGQYPGQYPGQQQPTTQSYLPPQSVPPTNVQPGQQPQVPGVCPSLPTVSSCPAGERKVVSYSSPECGTYYKCEPEIGAIQPPYLQPYPQPYPNPSTQCDWSREYVKVSTNACMPRTNCNDTTNSEYNTPECQGVRGSTGSFNQPPQPNCSVGQYWNGTSCVASGGSTQASGQRQMTWNSLGLSSQIRNDADSARIEQLKQACANTPTGVNIWMPGAGDYASPDFGMPNPDKCRQAASCSTNQYWDGSACVTGGAGGTQTGGGTGYSQCSASLTGLLGSGCHYMYNDSSGSRVFCDGPMSKSAKEGDTTATPGCSGGGYGGGATACPSGQYWNGTSCVSSTATTCPSGQWWNGTSCTTSTYPTYPSGSQCTSAEISALGDGCHYMNGTTPFNSAMTAYYQGGSVVQCSASPINGCSGSAYSSGSCPAGQYWSNGACVTDTTQTTSCPSGQYWNGSSCVSSTATTCPSGQYWNGSSCVSSTTTACPSSQYWNGSACVSSTTTTCPSGQYWNNGACVATSPTDCPSGQYWSGTSCVSSTTTTCPSGQYWNGSACVSSTTTTSCPSGQYWNGSSCATSSTGGYSSDPATACAQAGGSWDGSTCQMPSSTPPPTSFLQTQSILANMQAILEQLLRTLSR